MPCLSKKPGVALLMLAAGKSARLGTPKQLLEWKGQTLLQHMVAVALSSDCDSVTVVLGFESKKMKALLKDYHVATLVNPDPESGLGSSITCGVKHLMENLSDIKAVIIMLCDQPLVTKDLLNLIIRTWKSSGKSMVASSYAGVYGPPALFEGRYFQELSELQGDKGAKVLMNKYLNEMEFLSFQEGELDLDSQEDWERFLSKL